MIQWNVYILLKINRNDIKQVKTIMHIIDKNKKYDILTIKKACYLLLYDVTFANILFSIRDKWPKAITTCKIYDTLPVPDWDTFMIYLMK